MNRYFSRDWMDKKPKSRKIKEIERRACDKCGLVGDWKIYMDGRMQKSCPHCKTRGYSSIKVY